jgi:tetratricopeptide (TPR) repeat protein
MPSSLKNPQLVSVKAVVIASMMLFVSACQTRQPITEEIQQVENQVAEPEPAPEQPSESELSAELLYDILVAAIASQRNNPRLALESLSRAAYQSRDRRLIAEAIQLAMDVGEYQQSIELAQLFNRLEPENHLVILALARAHFKLGEDQNAISLLATLASNQTSHDVLVLQDIATLLSRQNLDNTLEAFLEYVDNDPDNEYLALTAALLAARLNEPLELTRLLDKTLELKPDWEIPAILKLTGLADNDVNAAHSFARQHLEEYPAQQRFRLQYARMLIQSEDIDNAVLHLKEILELNPDAEDALYTLGVIFLDQGMLEQAKSYLSRFLQLNPENDQSRIYLSDIEFEQQNYSAAAQLLHGVSSHRYYLDAQIKMARVIEKRDDLERALRYLQKIDVANDEDKTRIILEQDTLLRDHNLLDRSRLVLDEGLKQFPDNPDLLYNRGLLAAQMELLELHEQDMRRLIALEPENAHAYNALGYTLADQTDRLDEAMSLIEKANELLPDNPFILDSMGWIHFRLGNNEMAIKFLRQALDVRQDAEIAAHLGEVLWISGHKDEALKIWKQGTEWGPENAVLKETIERFSEFRESTNHLSSYYPLSIAGFHRIHTPTVSINSAGFC